MKIIGIYTALILLTCFALLFGVYYWISGRFDIESLGFIYVFLLIFFLKVLIIKNGKVRVYRFFWFLHKRNVVAFRDTEMVRIFINSSTGGSITISFWNKDGKAILDFNCLLYKFEINKLVKELQKENIEYSLSGSGSY